MTSQMIKSLSAAAALALAGCLGQDEATERALNARNLTFARAATVAASEAAVPGAGPDFKEQAAQIRAFGCPVLADAVEDLGVNTGTGVPASLSKIASCFGVSGKAAPEDIDTVWAQLKTDLPAVLDCICGGDALSSLLLGTNGGKLNTFSAATSLAASSAYGSSGDVGNGFDGSKSTVGKGYSSSGNVGNTSP